MPRISRKGSGPGLQAFKGEFAALHHCTDRPIIVALVVGGEIEREASALRDPRGDQKENSRNTNRDQPLVRDAVSSKTMSSNR